MLRLYTHIQVLLFASCFVFALSTAEPTVTLHLPATSVSAIFDQVEASTGTKLSMQASFKEMPLIVSVKNVPLSSFLANVGRALALEVEPIDGGYKLIRSPKIQAELAAGEAKTYAETWSKTLTRWSGVLTGSPWSTQLANTLLKKEEENTNRDGRGLPLDDDSSRQRSGPRLTAMTPSARLLFKFLTAFGPAELGRIGAGKTIIFSRLPNRVQRPMPAAMENWIRAYESESALNPPPPAMPDRDLGNMNEALLSNMSGRFQRSIPTLTGGIGKVLVVLTRDRATLYVYNKDGSDMDQAASPGYNDLGPEPNSPAAPKLFKDLQPITPSSLSKELIAFSDAQYSRYDDDGNEQSPDATPVSPALQTFLLNPEKTDPQSLLVSEVLLSYADQKQLNLVASVDDYYSDPAAFLPDEGGRDQIDVADAMNSIIGDEPNISPDAGWAVYQPEDLVSQESAFIPRSATGKYARDSIRSGYSLESDIAFCRFVNPDHYSNWYYSDNPIDVYLQDQLGDHEMPGLLCAKFLGSLNGPQRQILAKGGTLNASSFTPVQLNALSEWIYDPSSSMTGDMSWGGDGEGMQPLYFQQPTERFPNGIPPQTAITLSSQQESGYMYAGELMSPKMVAAAILLADVMPPDDPEREYMPDLQKSFASSVVQTRYSLVLTFAPGKQFTESFTYDNRQGNRRRMTLSQLSNVADVKNWLGHLKGMNRDQLMSTFEGMDEMDENVDNE